MIGLVYKDFLVMRKLLTYYLFFVLIYVVLVVVGVFDMTILPAMVVVFALMLPMSSIGYDDQARWAPFAAATPAGRRGVVMAKYVFSLLSILASSAVVLLLMAALTLVGITAPGLEELGLTLLGCICVGLVLNALILPLLLKFGAEKSRIISMILFVAVFGVIFLGAQLVERGALVAVPGWLVGALPVVLGIVAVGGFAVSYFIACGIYGSKEF